MLNFSKVECYWSRCYGNGGTTWSGYLVTMCVFDYPQARAVVDDFGNLVCVTGFR